MLPQIPFTVQPNIFFRSSRKYLREAKRSTKPLVISRGRKAEFVILPLPLYEEVLDAWERWREDRISHIVQEGRKEYQAGKLKPIRSLTELD